MSDQRNDPKLPLPEPPERAILLDLIAEVYAAHDRDDLYYTAAARESLMVSATDRAEARLRTLQTPGGPAGADLKEGEGSGYE